MKYRPRQLSGHLAMDASVTIRFEKPLAGASPAPEFPALAANWDALDAAARELRLYSPFDFVSETPEEYSKIMKEVKAVEQELQSFDINEIKDNPEFKKMLQDLGDDPAVQELMSTLQQAQTPEELLGQAFPDESPGEEWYEPAEGIEFLTRLREHVRENPGEFENVEPLLREFTDLEDMLQAAERDGVKFYLALKG
jgi:hypothetical protein